MKFLIFIFITAPAFGALSPDLVKDRALKYHPSVLAALESMRAAEETVRGTKGAFDTRIVSDYKRQTKESWNITNHRTQIEKPLRIANSKIYAGSEQVSRPAGRLEPFNNTGNPATTGQAGVYSLLGFRLSLLKNMTIDPSRAAYKNAKFEATRASGERTLTELDISRLGQLAYWEWVTAKKVENAYNELYKNGETRREFLETRNKKGDIARIVVTENEQYVASRKGNLQAARERLLRSEYALSLFNRDDNGEPIIPQADEVFEDYPSDLAVLLQKLDLHTDVDQLVKKRPDMKNLALAVDKSEVDLSLARQDILPQVDVATEYFQRNNPNSSMPRDYLMVYAQVTVPLEFNLGKGNIAAASARKMVAQRQMALGVQSYKFEVLALRKSLDLRLERVKQAEIEFSKSKELVESETYRFKTGGGNLFLVNLREEAQASAEAAFHEARLAFMDTLLMYQAMVSTNE